MKMWKMDVGTVYYEREDDSRALIAAAEFFCQIECDCHKCSECKLERHTNGAIGACFGWVQSHPEETLKILGAEAVKE